MWYLQGISRRVWGRTSGPFWVIGTRQGGSRQYIDRRKDVSWCIDWESIQTAGILHVRRGREAVQEEILKPSELITVTSSHT